MEGDPVVAAKSFDALITLLHTEKYNMMIACSEKMKNKTSTWTIYVGPSHNYGKNIQKRDPP
jgi:hypothetical protein